VLTVEISQTEPGYSAIREQRRPTRLNGTAEPVETDISLNPVSEEAIEASIAAKGIGQKIRRLRLRRSMGLVELGQRVGLSASFLSQLETGRIVPTVKNLALIALVFKTDLAHFVRDEIEAPFRISRAYDRPRLAIGNESAPLLISEKMSVLVPDRNIVPCIAEFLSGSEEAVFHPQLFSGTELVYVIRGSLTLATETKTELLETADSVWIDGNSKRLYRRHNDKPAKALIVPFSLHS
jgi:transcriptional regulator with XRE-family HTH domain